MSPRLSVVYDIANTLATAEASHASLFNMVVFTFSWHAIIGLTALLAVLYVYRINILLKTVPDEVLRMAGPRWTADRLRETYDDLKKCGIDYTDRIPPKQNRRYIVTGGNGKHLL